MTMMNIILLERVEKLGQMGDVVAVRPGYARNFLLPKGKATRATPDNLKRFEEERTQLEARNLERRGEAEKLSDAFAGLEIIIIRAASESGQLYGSVTARDIAAAVSEAGISLERTQVRMDRPIKTLGIHSCRAQLHPEVTVGFEANVAQTPEEAATQRQRMEQDAAAAQAEKAAAKQGPAKDKPADTHHADAVEADAEAEAGPDVAQADGDAVSDSESEAEAASEAEADTDEGAVAGAEETESEPPPAG